MDLENLNDYHYESNILFFTDYINYIYLYMKECVPTVSLQAIENNYKGLAFCFIINLFCSFLHRIPGKYLLKDILICMINTLTGVHLLLTSFETGAWNIMLFVVTSVCIICVIKPLSRSMGILGLCAVYIVFNELSIDPKQWHARRGSFMILLMKLLGYLMSPCSILHGPWFDYRAYDKWTSGSVIGFRSIIRCVRTYCLGLAFLLYSTCIGQLIFSILPGNKWIRAYQDAQSFRFSHYFISYLSLSYLSAMNIDHTIDPSCSKDIVDPLSIELPRSLIDVVTLWNLPMHYWLKNYVFLSCIRFGRFAAILLTFIVSSLLHGFNFALSGILVTLGLYSYIEYVLRSQLARSVDACIKARPCRGVCSHKYKKNHLLTIVINVIFTGFAMFHLAYIAAMLDDSVGHAEGYSMRHTLKTWGKLHFSGHIIVFVSYFVYLIIRCRS